MDVEDHSVDDFTANAEANRAVIELVNDGLAAFNESVCPDPAAAPVTLSIRNEDRVIAGLLGSNAHGWMRVDMVWVDERHRGRGVGTALLEKAEQVARARGCHGIHLDTQSYQAPGFYEKLGYVPFARLESYPGDHQRIYLRKDIGRG